jgi:hypothetical protein
MRKQFRNIAILLSAIVFITAALNSCKKKQTIPELTTSDITYITSSSAVCGGSITSDGGGNIMEVGICWSTSEMPTIESSKTRDDYGQGLFSLALNNLTSNTTYYVRAYASNPEGTGYGNQVSFKTLN